jgi:uncharacterized protein (DUF2235 family)
VALYAFDGTWNKDKPGTDEDTNVLKFANAYRPQDSVHYQSGVGTRLGLAGRIVGGITGAGALSRIKRALDRLERNFKDGDTDIDVIGFSRGAAIAIEFAFRVFQKGVGRVKQPPVRFLGLWDCVPSFGIPGNDKNIGWHVNNLPDNVGHCFHALALDERRGTFPLNRLSARVDHADQPGRLFELWFRGVHSDVGGGNKNPGLSDGALHAMFKSALRCGLDLDPAAVEQARLGARPDTPISVHKRDPIPDPFRIVNWNDRVHVSVSFRADEKPRAHNNPPPGVEVVDDDGIVVGRFSV